MSGKHLVVDIIKINDTEKIEKVENIKVLMEQIIEENNLNVVGEVHKQFEPVGATCLYLLAESHLTCHTYPEKNYMALDLYCCNDKIEFKNVLDLIHKFFNCNCMIRPKAFIR